MSVFRQIFEHEMNLVNDSTLYALDANRRLVDTEDASTLARCRANPTGEFREIVGQQKSVERIPPLILENESVPLRNDIGDRASII